MFKKIFAIFIFMFFSINTVFSAVSNTDLVRSGIVKYKNKNFAGCISTMKDAIKNDPSNVTAHYYLAIAYARMGNKTEAINYYTKVVNLNSNATLTSYAKQGLAAINDGYKYSNQNAEAENFVKTYPKESINPEIRKNLKLLELERKKEEINKKVNAPAIVTQSKEEKVKEKDVKKEDKKTEETDKTSFNGQPTDAEIAQAVRTFAALGINPMQMGGANAQMNSMAQYQNSQAAQDYAQLQMMLGSQNNNSFNNNNMMNFLPYLMQQNGQNNKNLSQDFIQTMMMTQMMPDFSFDTSNK
ncbi:tetratricopeptide repeat protein [bacterium]|nr:tetratricopeptide repeat protein [bacterium]